MVVEDIKINAFSERLQVLKNVLRLNTTQIAKKADITAPTLNRIETGKTPNPGIDIIIKLNKAFGVRADWMLFGKGPIFESDATVYQNSTEEELRVWKESMLKSFGEEMVKTFERLKAQPLRKRKSVPSTGQIQMPFFVR